MALAGSLALALVILGGFVEGAIWWYGAGGAAFGGLFAIWESLEPVGVLCVLWDSKPHCDHSHSIVPGGLCVIS